MNGYVDGEKRRKIEEYMERRGITSLMDVTGRFPGLGTLLGLKGIEQRRTKGVRFELYNKGFLQELPFEDIVYQIVTKGKRGINPYLDPEIVGDDAEVNRRKVIDSKEFGEAICERYGSLNGVDCDYRISKFLQVDWQKPIVLRRALFEMNFLTEIDISELLDTLERAGAPNSYLREDVVGDMVEYYREAVIRSREFREEIKNNFDSLHDLGGTIPNRIYLLMGVRRSQRQDLKREFFRRGFFTEVPIEVVAASFSTKGRISPYLDSEIVGDRVEEHREIVLSSDYFREEVQRNFPTINKALRSRGLATLFGVQIKSRAMRNQLVRRGFYE